MRIGPSTTASQHAMGGEHVKGTPGETVQSSRCVGGWAHNLEAICEVGVAPVLDVI